MNLEEGKGEKKAKGIAFQVESHVEETDSICDDDDLAESIAEIIKRLTKFTEAVQEVGIRVEFQPVFQHLEGIPPLLLKILM